MSSIGILLLRLLLTVFALLPFRLLYLLSNVIRFVLSNVVRYRYAVIKSNLQKAFPEKTPPEIASLVQAFYKHFTDVLLESLKGPGMSAPELRSRFVYVNPEIFDPLYEAGQSALLLGSHYGNWEWGVLSFPLAVRHKVIGIYKPMKNKKIDACFNRLRRRWGLHLASMSGAGRAVVENRGSPCIFVLIADQTPSDVKNAHWLTFLHQDTPFLHGPDKLARQTGYPVFIYKIKRTARGYYEVTFEELCSDPKMAVSGEITQRFSEILENCIRENPVDWLWSHRRWKRKRAPTS